MVYERDRGASTMLRTEEEFEAKRQILGIDFRMKRLTWPSRHQLR
jgi:preprotein translocase subunit SecE